MGLGYSTATSTEESEKDPPDRPPATNLQDALLADLRQHFEKKQEPVEDSWFVLSLKSDEASGIELFLAEGDDDDVEKTDGEKGENSKLVNIQIPPAYKTSIMDTNTELIESYPFNADAKIETDTEEAEKSTDPSHNDEVEMAPAQREDQMAIKISAKENQMHFSPPELGTADNEELKRLKAQVSELSSQLNRMNDLEDQITMLRSVFASINTGGANISGLMESIPNSAANVPPAAPESSVSFGGEAVAAVVTAVAPPPPPPPPPAPPVEGEGNGEPKKKKKWEIKKPEVKELTEQEVENVVRSEIGLSGKTPVAIKKATENFLNSFSKLSHKKLLKQMATDYPFLIRSLPLQPLECVKRMVGWEKQLFRDMENKEERDALRKRKQVEICTIAAGEIATEVKKIHAAEAVRKQKEKEAKEKAETRGNLLDALKDQFAKGAKDKEEAQTEQELKELEVGTLDDLDDFEM